MPPHIIRLREPWECEPIEGQSQARVCFTRRFGLPTNLTPSDRVWLVIDGANSGGVASLNDTPLGEFAGEGTTAEFEITDRLLPRNHLRLDIDLPQNEGASDREPSAPFCEVRLEIRS